MEFTREDCKFSIPDRPTVRQQMRYFSAASSLDPVQQMERFWAGAIQLIEKWECEKMPDHKVDIDTLSDPSIVPILIWAGLEVRKYINDLEDLPKNS